MAYRQRVVDIELQADLRAAGAVLLEGPRACGKTSTGRQYAQSHVFLDTDDAALAMVETAPGALLQGPTPRLIDEWQLAPRIWNHVRHAIDDRGSKGQFILTGSANPSDDVTRHSGAGRILRLRMRPMSLYESGHSDGSVSLKALLEGESVEGARSGVSVEDLSSLLVVGGWPALQGDSPAVAQRNLRSYLDDVARTDVVMGGDGVARRDPGRVARALRSYARHVGTGASARTLAADTGVEGEAALYVDTIRDYIAALARIWVVEEQPSWGPHLRSKDVVRKAPVRHFVDPSLAAAALGASPERLLRDPRTFGLLFESMALRDLRVLSQSLDGEVRHYRDSAGTEADAVIQLRDGRWALVEVKLAASKADEAAASLQRLTKKLDTSRIGAPVARIIITGGEYAYSREDGIHVVPLACLGP